MSNPQLSAPLIQSSDLEKVLTKKIAHDLETDLDNAVENTLISAGPGMGVVSSLFSATKQVAQQMGKECVNVNSVDPKSILPNDESSVLFLEVSAQDIHNAAIVANRPSALSKTPSALGDESAAQQTLTQLKALSLAAHALLVIDFKGASDQAKQDAQLFLASRKMGPLTLTHIPAFVSDLSQSIADMPQVFKDQASVLVVDQSQPDLNLSSALAGRRGPSSDAPTYTRSAPKV